MSEWRPIETAPRCTLASDSEPVFLIAHSGIVEAARWYGDEKYPWRVAGDEEEIRNAIAWMPLPTPPQEPHHD